MYNFIKVQPCKNNIGALININLNKVNNDVINEINEVINCSINSFNYKW